jgi:hypothetical protein
MQFLKKHYEKIILSVVLLGLAGVAAWLSIQVKFVREDLDAQIGAVTPTNPPVAGTIPAAPYSNRVYRASHPVQVDLAASNKVFSPQTIIKLPDGTVKRQSDIGAGAVQVRSVVPLYLEVKGLVGVAADRVSYNVIVIREYELKSSDRSPRNYSVTPGSSPRKVDNRMSFRLLEAKGAVGDTTELTVELALDGATNNITLSKDKPFKLELGYAANLFYPPDNQTWANKHETEDIVVSGETNNIVAIRTNEVVLSSNQSLKRTILKVIAQP